MLSVVPTNARGTKIGQLRISRRVQIVNLNQRDTGSVILASYDSGVPTRRKGRNDGGFQIVHWRNARRFDLRLLSISPIIIG